MNWIELTNIDQLKTIKEESNNQPVLIFKHSTTCSISAMSLNRFERKFDINQAENLKCYYLDLKAHRDISNQIAEDFDIDHESPQVLLIEVGKVSYNASHYDISFDELVAELA